MKLFFDYKTKRNLAVLLNFIPENVGHIYAAIAFSYDDLLIQKCIEKKIHLEWWGLFNSDISTSIELIKTAIKSSFIKFYPYANNFHPKVIYFENYGLYIGSANMTKNGLYNNVEAGTFIEEIDLTLEMKSEIQTFFNFLRDKSFPITVDDIEILDEYIEEIENDENEIARKKASINDLFDEKFQHLFLLKTGVTDWEKTKKDTENRRKLIFLQEWRETQNFIAIVHHEILNIYNKLTWVTEKADAKIVTDQLLQSYYYDYILKGKEERKKSIVKVNESYEKNKKDPLRAVEEAMEWWQQNYIPDETTIYLWGPENKKILNTIRDRDITYEEFHKVLSQNYAAVNHARQIQNKFFNLLEDFKTNLAERTEIYTKWLFNQKSSENLNINAVLRYLLFEDNIPLEERIYNALYNEKYRIERLGRSIIGELVGWCRTDITHIRNNRVNKALRCFGYDVRLFSD
jgi:hypothetical protein